MLSGLNLPVNLLYACLLGIGGCALGVLGLLALPASIRRAERYATLMAFCLAGLSGAAAFLGKPQGLWLPSLTVSAGWLLVQLTRCSWVNILASRAVRVLRHPGVQVALLLAVSPVVVVSLLWPPPETNVPIHRAPREFPARLSALRSNKIIYALTDLDTPIALLAMPHQEAADNLADMEQHFVGELARNNLLICTGPAEAGYNCHGWVFTGGRYWIDGVEVERILAENGYQRVTTPRPGDLAIYRNDSEITHSAVVRTVEADGLLLVESKWGQLGRYIHPADKLNFGHPPVYYRSSRQGHLLRGLERAAAPDVVAVRPPVPEI